MNPAAGSPTMLNVGDRATVEFDGVRYGCKVVRPYGVYEVDEEGPRWGYIVKPSYSRQHLFVTAGQIRPARAKPGWRGHLVLVRSGAVLNQILTEKRK